MSPPTATGTQINGPKILARQRHEDERGWFEVLDDPELSREFEELEVNWQQWNISHSLQGVLRGLHFQSPHWQAKLIRVVQGEIWDVVVDLREGSSTFGKWQVYELSAEKAESLYIPEGFAHGFLTMSPEATLIYAVNRPRCVESEQIIRWDDPEFAIPWPIEQPVLSERDAHAKPRVLTEGSMVNEG